MYIRKLTLNCDGAIEGIITDDVDARIILDLEVHDIFN